MNRRIDLTGQRFGRLTVTNEWKTADPSQTLWRCVCDCDNETWVRVDHLVAGRIRSCGCLHLDTITGNKYAQKRDI